MAENLFPEDFEQETADTAEIYAQTPIGYKPGVAFDDESGDFVRDGRNRVIGNTGVESWKSWVVNCLQTERYAHLAYNSDFGIEYRRVFAAESREEAESILARQITEALLADEYGRTAYVEDMTFTWPAADAVQVDATIVGIDDITIDITAYMTLGGNE